MNCEQFQRVLPQIIESGGSSDEEVHLSSCEACSELVRDLKYIAEQARLLLPLRDPNPRVWRNIQESLAREGLTPTTATKQEPGRPPKNPGRGPEIGSSDRSSSHRPYVSSNRGSRRRPGK